jgi:protein ImuB
VLYEQDARYGERVKFCSAAAWERGVRPDLPLAEVLALEQYGDVSPRSSRPLPASGTSPPAAEPFFVAPHDAGRDRETLTRLAAWCERFSPIVGLDQVDQPDCLLLDISGLAHLFGGESGLADSILKQLARHHLAARVAIADTVSAAWAVARLAGSEKGVRTLLPGTGPSGASHKRVLTPFSHAFSHVTPFSHDSGSACRIVPPGDQAAVDCLPVQALRLPERVTQQLSRLGLHTLGSLRELSRTSLGTRFGDHLVERLDQLTGHAPQVIVSYHQQAAFAVRWSLEHATTRHDALQHVLAELVQRLSRQLVAQSQGVLQLQAQLICRNHRPLNIDISLFQPTVNAQHLLALANMQLAALHLPDAVEEIRVSAPSTAPCQQRQKELFADAPRDNPGHLALLIERLSGRLGRERVVGARLQADALPEAAYAYYPLTGRQPAGAADDDPIAAAAVPQPMLRPLQLFQPPRPVEVVGIALDGPPALFHYRRQRYRIARCLGPERIETGWWRGPSVRRDYYHVQTDTGSRLWLFRCLQDNRWFLHGEF